jgi:hypothetical protein
MIERQTCYHPRNPSSRFLTLAPSSRTASPTTPLFSWRIRCGVRKWGIGRGRQGLPVGHLQGAHRAPSHLRSRTNRHRASGWAPGVEDDAGRWSRGNQQGRDRGSGAWSTRNLRGRSKIRHSGITTGAAPARSTSLYEGDAPSPAAPEGETSLHFWNLERPAVAQGVVQGPLFSNAGGRGFGLPPCSEWEKV